MGYEYEINTWLIGYNGECFRQHLSLPSTLQTAVDVGNPLPVFYGFLLVKLAGLISAAP